MAAKVSQEIVTADFLTRNELSLDISARVRGVNNPEELILLFEEHGIALDNNEIDGVEVIEILDSKTKGKLVDVPLLLLDWKFSESEIKGDDGSEKYYVIARVLDRAGNKYLLVDGSTGIYQQLRDITEARVRNGHPSPWAGRKVSGGLRRSDYVHEGTGTQATTYYLQF